VALFGGAGGIKEFLGRQYLQYSIDFVSKGRREIQSRIFGARTAARVRWEDGPNDQPKREASIGIGIGERLQTVVTPEYKVEEKENGLKSRFEIR